MQNIGTATELKHNITGENVRNKQVPNMTAFTLTRVDADKRQILAFFGSHVSLMERADH